MTTLVTGIGLVGTSFALQAIQRGERIVFCDFLPRMDYLRQRLGNADVSVVQSDIRDLPALIGTIQEHQVDTVVHTVGLIANRVSESLYNGLAINVTGAINVLEAVRLTGVKRLVHISTFSVYDRRLLPDRPTTENMPRGPGRAYGNSKVVQELLAETYRLQYGFELVILRPAQVYGPGHFWGGSGGGEKVQLMLEAAMKGEVAKIPQEQTMDFEYIYCRDVGRAVDLSATIPLPKELAFNIGTGEVVSFQGLVETVQRIFPGFEVEVVPGRPPAVSAGQPLDISRAKAQLDWEPEYSLEAGLREYVEDLRAVMGGRP